MQNRALVALYRRKFEKKFFKMLKVEEIKCRDISTSSQVEISNNDGVVLEIYFEHTTGTTGGL